MDFPAVDVPHPQGLDFESAFSALEVFASAPRCTAVAVTEFSAELDPDGSHAASLVEGLVKVLGS